MPEIKYHPKARAEAFRTAEFYQKRVPGLGAEFFDELERTVEQLLQDPLRRPADPDGIRNWRLKRFPFRVYYAFDAERIRILAVAHLRRQTGYWRQRIDD
jgi:plasmid stabilization system protein ParE